MALLSELKRRNVFRVGAAYVVIAWLIIQVVETIFPAFGFDDSAVRIATIALGIGFVPMLAFAWVFELTPEGLKREKHVDRSASITSQTGQKLNRLTVAVLLLALGYFVADKFVLAPQREAALQQQQAVAVEQAREQGRSEARTGSVGDKSIAVLAFDDMSPEKDQEYLSDGIAEELLNLLAKVPELRVISRSSAFSFKGQSLEIPEIARRLNVAHVLEGSVRKAGKRVRITAQLIEASTDSHLWSETYDRTLDDVFAVQDEIATTVVEQLKIKLLGAAPHIVETDPTAYTLYLQARHAGTQLNAAGFDEAIKLFRQALAIDPDFVSAWVGLAKIYFNQTGNGLLPIDEGYGLARDANDRALAIDPNYAPALANLGYVALVYDRDLAKAAGEFQRALALDAADANILRNAASLLSSLGRFSEAIEVQEYVTDRDPLNQTGHRNLGVTYMSADRLDDAMASLQAALQLSPASYGAHYLLGMALLFKGEAQAALLQMQAESDEVFKLIGLSAVHHALGQTEASDAALAELIASFEREAAYNIAYVLAYRNEADRAFEWLEKAVTYSDPGLSEIVGQLEFESIQGDPRWLPFLERIGYAPAQLDAIEFEVKLPQ